MSQSEIETERAASAATATANERITPSPESAPGPAAERRGGRLPPWLRRPIGGGEVFQRTARAVRENRLNTICEDAHCPNRGECWSAGTATFLILGDLCTRRCGFCSVQGGRPKGVIDAGEPERLANAVELMRLKYVVVTSVDRDDLPDKGAGHFAETIRALRTRNPEIEIELLTPDFRGKAAIALEALAPLAPFVWGHNVETVPRLYRTVRPGSGYEDSLDLLRQAARIPGVVAKSSLMLGLGETQDEVRGVMDDLLAAGVQRITLGQYLQPTPDQLPVLEYIHPDVFAELGRSARAKGFRWVISEPFARSSYHAEARETPGC